MNPKSIYLASMLVLAMWLAVRYVSAAIYPNRWCRRWLDRRGRKTAGYLDAEEARVHQLTSDLGVALAMLVVAIFALA